MLKREQLHILPDGELLDELVTGVLAQEDTPSISSKEIAKKKKLQQFSIRGRFRDRLGFSNRDFSENTFYGAATHASVAQPLYWFIHDNVPDFHDREYHTCDIPDSILEEVRNRYTQLQAIRSAQSKACIEDLKNYNQPGSYRNLLRACRMMYKKAAECQISGLVDKLTQFERIAFHQLRLPAAAEALYSPDILDRTQELNDEVMQYVHREKPLDRIALQKIQKELWGLSCGHCPKYPQGIEYTQENYSEEHISFVKMTFGNIVICDLLTAASQQKIEDFEQYIGTL